MKLVQLYRIAELKPVGIQKQKIVFAFHHFLWLPSSVGGESDLFWFWFTSMFLSSGTILMVPCHPGHEGIEDVIGEFDGCKANS